MPITSKSFSEIATTTRASNATYFDSSGRLKTSLSNQPRLDYNPSTLAIRGLQVEEQRTNLSSGSEYFDNWPSNFSPIIKRFVGVAPTGATNATEITATTSTEGIYRILTTTSGTAYTLSIFMKNVSNASSIRLGCDSNPSNGWIIVNLVTGVISSSGAGVTSSSIQNLPNGWYRVSVTFSSTSTTSSFVIYNTSGSTARWYIWGSQAEAGSFLTSYIHAPTTTNARESVGTYFDSAGILQTAGIDVARQTYNPSDLTAPPFLLVEPERTNSIRNNTMTGAVAGFPGTLPTNWNASASSSEIRRYIVGTGTEKGIPYIDVVIFGIVSTSRTYVIYFDGNTAAAATNGQTWTLSSFVKLISGTLSRISSIKLGSEVYTSSPAYSSTLIDFAITPNNDDLNKQRYSSSATISDAAAAYVLPFIKITTESYGGPISVTLRIGLPQLELGNYSTSPIQTTSAAVTRSADSVGATQATRAADSISLSALTSWYNTRVGTLFVEASTAEGQVASSAAVISLSDGTGSNTHRIIKQSDSQPVMQTLVGGSTSATLGFGATWTNEQFRKLAYSYNTNDFAGSVNGSSVQTDTVGNLPAITVLELGQTVSGTQLNGHIKRMAYYPRRLTNAELQAITT